MAHHAEYGKTAGRKAFVTAMPWGFGARTPMHDMYRTRIKPYVSFRQLRKQVSRYQKHQNMVE